MNIRKGIDDRENRDEHGNEIRGTRRRKVRVINNEYESNSWSEDIAEDI